MFELISKVKVQDATIFTMNYHGRIYDRIEVKVNDQIEKIHWKLRIEAKDLFLYDRLKGWHQNRIPEIETEFPLVDLTRAFKFTKLAEKIFGYTAK